MASLPPGFNVESDGGERLHFSDADFVVRAAADATGGAISIVEEIAPLDTPLHVHEREDEIFYILDGDHVIQVANKSSRSVPRGSSSRDAALHTRSGVLCRGPGGSSRCSFPEGLTGSTANCPRPKLQA